MPQSVCLRILWLTWGGGAPCLLSWGLLCSQLEGLGEPGLCLPRTFILVWWSPGPGDERRSLPGLLTGRLGSHTSSLPPPHSFAQSQARASPGSRGGGTDSASCWEKQGTVVASFTPPHPHPPLRAAWLKLVGTGYWTGSLSSHSDQLVSVHCGFPSWGWVSRAKAPGSTPRQCSCSYKKWAMLKKRRKIHLIWFMPATGFLLKCQLVWWEILYSLLPFHLVSKIFPLCPLVI